MAVSNRKMRRKQKPRSVEAESLFEIAKRKFSQDEMMRFEKALENYVKSERGFMAHMCWVIVFSTLRDKFGFGYVRLSRMWENISRLLTEIGEHRIKLKDLEKALKEEAGIEIEMLEGRE